MTAFMTGQSAEAALGKLVSSHQRLLAVTLPKRAQVFMKTPPSLQPLRTLTSQKETGTCAPVSYLIVVTEVIIFKLTILVNE